MIAKHEFVTTTFQYQLKKNPAPQQPITALSICVLVFSFKSSVYVINQTYVSQAQLHRIAEHYLQKANLDVIRRCADTELAIADAVNVEKGIYERSNSKLIYVNLCSQATRQHAKAKSDNDTSSLTKRTESGSDQISQEVTSEDTNVSGSDVEEALNRAAVSDQKSELGSDTAPGHTVHKDTVSFSSAEDALRKAGLFDSPPNSPDRGTTEVEGNSDSMTVSNCPTISQRKY